MTSFFQDESTTLSTSFQPFTFGLTAVTLILSNDDIGGPNIIYWSYDGSSIGGKLRAGNEFSLTGSNITKIWLKISGSTPNYRVFALNI